MLKIGLCFFLLVFSGIASSLKAPVFSNLSLKEKIKKTHQIRKKQSSFSTNTLSSLKTKQKEKQIQLPDNKNTRNIRMMLSLPLENRLQSLSTYGQANFPILKALVLSRYEEMPVRWKALTSLARLYPEKSRPIILKSLRSSVWFLKNAGLIAMEIIDPKESVRWAGHLLNDPSLVVRTAAVNTIKKHKAEQYKFQLLEKLNSKDSFYKNKSLWIRHHIVSTLALFAQPGEEHIFISFLQDPDERLYPASISALEKLTGKNFHAKKIITQKQKWLTWWGEQAPLLTGKLHL